MTGVILAAGVGSRLGASVPKGLLVLPSGETILARQVRIMKSAGIDCINVVVGFQRAMIQQALTGVRFRYSRDFATTNTAKSLLCGLDGVDDDLLWCNGDVVFDEAIIPMITEQKQNTILVNNARCGDEEVKYVTDDRGNVTLISKQVANAEGEALGINMVKRDSLSELVEALRKCRKQDYFERGIQFMVDRTIEFKALSVSVYRCIEVDFEEDWKQAREMFGLQ